MYSRNEFYIGYLDKAPPGMARPIKILVLMTLAGSFLAGFAFLMAQAPFAFSFFEFQKYRTFQGKLIMQPYPHLLVRRPGLFGQDPRFSTYLLTAPFKFGAETILEEDKFANKEVILKGSLIYRKGQSMIELQSASVRLLVETKENPSSPLYDDKKEKLGRHILKGEIVDSKCYLGVMKPATRKIHRSCAIRCISGGIPPLFVVSMPNAKKTFFLLVSEKGQAINQAVLEFVAKPVRISGYVEKKGDLLILKADPKDYQLLY